MSGTSLDRESGVVLPLGQYLGASYDAGVPEPRAHLIRVGWQEGELVEPHDIDTWRLAHGAWSGPRGQWSLRDLMTVAIDAGIGDVDARIAAMERIGLLTVLTGDRELAGFARTHRVHPLMAGLGSSEPGSPVRGLGLVGQAPVAVVGETAYDVWQWAPRASDIWSAVTGASRRRADPAQQPLPLETRLRVAIRSIQTLVAKGALYVDRSVPAEPPRGADRRPQAPADSDGPGGTQ